jgi:hypothetical protein
VSQPTLHRYDKIPQILNLQRLKVGLGAWLEPLPSKFKPQYYQKKKKKRQNERQNRKYAYCQVLGARACHHPSYLGG